jgi:uncharacterized hydrophobic protein (TIGR00271 family)
MSLLKLFHLEDTDPHATIELVSAGVEFKGTNLWMLALGTFIASIGLNINSTAVIIGAMLISPLMGPIVGAGLALGIYDTALLKRSLFNLALMTVVSLVASAVYFSLSPIQEPSSEMLARTTPTFFDVLIAFFGGSAMIVSLTRKTRSSNALAGVAIATALMPPLCTAGYGLAMREWGYFFGAIYLYLINSIFIGMASYMFCKYLKLGKEAAVAQNLRRRQIIATIVAMVLFIAPSIWFALDMSMESTYAANVRRFVSSAMNFRGARVINYEWKRTANPPQIIVTLLGNPLSKDVQDHLTGLLGEYRLAGAELQIIQADNISMGSLSGIQASMTDTLSQAKVGGSTVLSSPQGVSIAPSSVVAQPSPKPAVQYADDLVPRQQLPESSWREHLAAVEQELYVAFPQVSRIVWGDVLSGPGDINVTQRVFVRWDTPEELTAMASVRGRLESWLRLRLQKPRLELN